MTLRASNRSLTIQTALVIIGRLVGFVFAFAIPVVLVRVLDQTAFGTYKQFFLVAGFLLGVAPLGFDATLFFFMPQDPERAGSYALQAATISFLLAAISGVFIWVFRDALASELNSPVLAQIMVFLAVYISLEIVGGLIENAIIIEKQAALGGVVFAASDAIRAIAIIAPAVITRNVYWVAVGAALYAVVRFTAAISYGVWRFRKRFARTGVARIGQQVRYAIPFGGAGLVQHALIRYHFFFVASAFAPATFAIYAVGSQQIAPIQIFFKSLFQVALVRMTEYFGAGRFDEMRSLWQTLIAKQAVAIVPFVVIMALLTPAFIEGVFTADYLDAVPVFRVSLLLIVLTMLNDHAVLRAVGSTKFILFANTMALVTTVVAVRPLTGAFGIAGAAMGLVVGMAMMKLLGLMRLRHLLQMSVSDMLPWRRVVDYTLASLIAAAVVYLTLPIFSAPLVRFFICGGLFWIVYAVVGWIGNFFSADDKRVIVDMARSTGSRLGVLTR